MTSSIEDDSEDPRADGPQYREGSQTLRERLQHVETTQTYLADTQDDIADTQDEILDAIHDVSDGMPDAERIDEIAHATEHNRRYVAILKWVGTGASVLAGSSVVAWALAAI